MTYEHGPYFTAISDLQGVSPLNEEEIAVLRHRAWVEQGLLIVSFSDKRLILREKRALALVAERLYGWEDLS